MRTLDSIHLAETDDYKTILVDHDHKTLHLYLVTLEGWLAPRYVLAADEDAATDQATCEWKADCRATVLAVKQIPLRIRGWSATEF